MTSLLRNERCGILFWNKKKAPELSAPSGIGAADFAGAGTPLKFNSVDFRDGQQSLFATRSYHCRYDPALRADGRSWI